MAGEPRTPLIVDANILFGALIRDGTHRRLILHGALDLHAPDIVWEEMERNRTLLVAKSATTPASFDLLIGLLRSRVASIPDAALQPFKMEAQRRCGTNTLDAPYVAAALAKGCPLWTHDKGLAKSGVAVVTTADLLGGES